MTHRKMYTYLACKPRTTPLKSAPKINSHTQYSFTYISGSRKRLLNDNGGFVHLSFPYTQKYREASQVRHYGAFTFWCNCSKRKVNYDILGTITTSFCRWEYVGDKSTQTGWKLISEEINSSSLPGDLP